MKQRGETQRLFIQRNFQQAAFVVGLAFRLAGVGGIKMQEQQAEAERQRQHHADRHIASAQSFAEQPHGEARQHREAKHARERREAEQHRAGRAGKADVGQRVAGKSLAAQYEEKADHAR